MTGRERTEAFIRGDAVDRPPFHPIVMRLAAQRAGVTFRDFCLQPEAKCRAMIGFARDFGADWVTVLSDPYCEAEAFGLEVEYPEDEMPVNHAPLLSCAAAAADLTLPDLATARRPRNRIEEVRRFAETVGDELFVVGWVEGPMAEYADLRGLSAACLDLIDEPDAVDAAAELLTENAKRLITAQVAAGAHCIGIGDAACSQIGPRFYRRHFQARETALVQHAHELGALAKLHICGDTRAILSGMIETGADIVDLDHLVGSMAPAAALLKSGQVLSGNVDPVSVVEAGVPATIAVAVADCWHQTGGRGIVSAGCEITPDTPPENLHACRRAAAGLTLR